MGVPRMPGGALPRTFTRNPHGHLLAAVAIQLIVLGVAPRPALQQSANVLLTLWIAAALFGLTGKVRTAVALLALGWTPALLELVIPLAASPPPLQILKECLWAAFPFLAGATILGPIFAKEEVGHRELAGAVTVYLLVGLGFAGIYEMIYTLDPGSLVFATPPADAFPAFPHFLYFSYVTLATLGYGDVSPVGTWSRLVAVLESLVGLLYVSIMVARLVSIHAATALRAKRDPDPS